MSGQLVMFVIYDHPTDWPDWYVARKWVGEEPQTDAIILERDLDRLRLMLARRGLVCLARQTEDDPVIVETWL